MEPNQNSDKQALQSKLKPIDLTEADLRIQTAKPVESAKPTEIGAIMLTKDRPETTSAQHITINFSLEKDPSEPEMGRATQAFETPDHGPKDMLYIRPRFTNAFGAQVQISSKTALYKAPDSGEYKPFFDSSKGQGSDYLFETNSEISVLVPTTHSNYVRLRVLASKGNPTIIEHTGIVTPDQLNQNK
ncbi:hypothetical protein KKG65_00050 [Patescibacteria group bacterium]|nr:hypothetical protein [Patescibacteria group bacterium]